MNLISGLARNTALLLASITMAACTYNPFIGDNHLTGTAAGTAVGVGAGAGSVALLGGTKSFVILGGIGGGAVGYYLSSLRNDSGGIIQADGKVYVLGEYIGIYIPTDYLFEPNTADFLPRANFTLDSIVAVLQRKPNNNIMISGSTSGFSRVDREQFLSQRRAKAIAAYLWTNGVIQFKENSNDLRHLKYVGYGDYFPVATHYNNEGVRSNSRIQITSYPSYASLVEKGNEMDMNNIAAMNDRTSNTGDRCGRGTDAYGNDEC